MTEIPVVCRNCGKGGGIYAFGSVTMEAWRDCKVVYDAERDGLKAIEGSVESDAFPDEHDFELEGYRCSQCAAEASKIDALVTCPYGVDTLGRWLDEDGNPHGPARVHPNQQQLELA